MAVNTNSNSMKNKYFPNNIEAIQDAPVEFFEPCTWEEFQDWKLSAWELPSSVLCLIRVVNNTTGKIHEKVYQKPSAARRYVEKQMDKEEDIEFLICNHETIHHVFPTTDEDQDDEDQ